MSEKHPLIEAMGDLAGAKSGKMEFRGKKYSTVALRVEMLRKHYATDVSIRTRLIHRDDQSVVVEARVYVKADDGWRFVANGFAEEARNAGNVNKTSALENCETSAIGRALASLGLGGGEYASADELTGSVQQEAPACISNDQAQEIRQLIADTEADEAKFLKWLQVESVEAIPSNAYQRAVAALRKKASSEAA